MKKILLLIPALILGCSGETLPENTLQTFTIPDIGSVREACVIEIDKCEYIVSGSGNNFAMTHKGNCRNHYADTVYIPVPSENHSEIK